MNLTGWLQTFLVVRSSDRHEVPPILVRSFGNPVTTQPFQCWIRRDSVPSVHTVIGQLCTGEKVRDGLEHPPPAICFFCCCNL